MNKSITAQDCRRALNARSATVLLISLFCGDLFFVVLHSVNVLTPILDNPLFSVEKDRGYAEIYQYIKLFWISALLVLMARENRSLHYVSWALLFFYFLCDDALQIHEQVGSRIAESLSFAPPLGLRRQDVGELVASASVGFFLVSPLLWAFSRGSQVFKKLSQDIALLIAALIFFGVVVDTVHSASHLDWKAKFILGLMEDGGEMLSVSLILWYTFLLKVRGERSDCYLCDFVCVLLKKRLLR